MHEYTNVIEIQLTIGYNTASKILLLILLNTIRSASWKF